MTATLRQIAAASTVLLAGTLGAQKVEPVGPMATVAAPVVAPRAVSAAFGRRGSGPRDSLAHAATTVLARRSPRERTDWWAPIASAVAPGTGQARLGQDRFVAYMAVEGFLWTRYFVHRKQGNDERDEYRGLALRVSRAAFGGAKPQGDFEYYERMEHWIASGVYDADPGAAFVPESDTTTFNGAMWQLARRTYWPSETSPPPAGSPAYLAAVAFYERYAIPSEFQWSWREAPLYQDVYRRHIRASNDAFRRTITDVGAVIANHVLSTVDAYVSLRLRLRDTGAATGEGIELSASIPLPTLGTVTRLRRTRTGR